MFIIYKFNVNIMFYITKILVLYFLLNYMFNVLFFIKNYKEKILILFNLNI